MPRSAYWTLSLISILCSAHQSPASSLISNASQPTAAGIAGAVAEMSLDPDQTYRVRELELTRGDIRVYLTEGILSFATPVAGHRIAAIFTTIGVEAGDAEILVLPPQRSERASLASFTGTPNLDEHFTSALFLFTDETEKEISAQIGQAPVRKAPQAVTEIARTFNPLIRDLGSSISVRLIESMLDNHKPADGLFYSALMGRELGAFDVTYEPTEFEPVAVGRASRASDAQLSFQLWTSFRPRHAPAYIRPPVSLSDFHMDTTIRPDLSMSVSARFSGIPITDGSRVIPLGLSERLKVTSATIDGKPVEVFQSNTLGLLAAKTLGTFLLISNEPLVSKKKYEIELHYEGSVIRQTPDHFYFVDERNAWYPYASPMLANFDLTFRCPERLRLVSTGELVNEEVTGGERIVHRRTEVPERVAGFNLGDYNTVLEEHGRYRVECYANRDTLADTPAMHSGAASASNPNATLQELATETQNILDDYTERWIQLPIHSLAVSPIPGYFGQGFPGLIYLSTVSYMREEERPNQLRSPQMDTFFSQMLLPHEIAHQWWGNIVTVADYRSDWLTEAMANYAALEFLKRNKGQAAVDQVLTTYRNDLTREDHGKTIESAGPVDFGLRLQQTKGMGVWHTILYEKGTWILHMLRQRLGDQGFANLQLRLLRDFAAKPLNNEDFRKAASDYVPAGQPDKSLTLFFESWVDATGIPALRLHRIGNNFELKVSAVDDDFTADVPLQCTDKNGKEQMVWVRASSGSNTVQVPRGMSACKLPAPTAFLYSP